MSLPHPSHTATCIVTAVAASVRARSYIIGLFLRSANLLAFHLTKRSTAPHTNGLESEMPGIGVIFAIFIQWQALFGLPLMLSGVGRIIVRFIKVKLSRTERQQQ
eukprot:gb/GEZJ01000020.1/.p5 GENE.gb/GEZJ01000020.1/~~gb/GEZJ01000020.1/.p5  ORF type:complete len:105 (-),score=12.95 gb/GEZJ01000020.1/:3072-3386(-)